MYILSMYFLFMYVPSKTQRKGIPIGTFIVFWITQGITPQSTNIHVDRLKSGVLYTRKTQVFGNPCFQNLARSKKNVGNHLPIELNGFNHFSGVFSRGAMVCHGLPESWSLVGLCFGWVLRGHHVLFKAPFAKFPTFKVGPHNTFFDQPGHRDARNADCSVQSPFGYQVHGGWPAMYCNQKLKPTATFNSGVMSESGVNIPVKFLQ
jgi:hypothetical protein